METGDTDERDESDELLKQIEGFSFEKLPERTEEVQIVDRFEDMPVPTVQKPASSRVAKPARELVTKKQMEETIKRLDLTRVLRGISEEVHQLFPPESKKFQVSAADILRKNQEAEQAQLQQQTSSEWPIPPNVQPARPIPTTSDPGLDRHNMFTREAMKNPIWGQYAVNAAYLEDRIPSIYTSQIRDKIPPELRGLDDAQRRRYTHILNEYKTPREQIVSEYPISKVLRVNMQKSLRYKFAVYDVQRADGQKISLNEADFRHVKLYDIEFIYEELSTKINKSYEEQQGRSALMKYMKRFIEFIQEHDLQLGAESNQLEVNLLRPLQHHMDLQTLEELTVIDENHPSFSGQRGVIFVNQRRRKIMVRMIDLMAYSDGTLKLLFHRLQEKAERDQSTLSETEMAGLIRTIEQVKRTLDSRRIIRRWQMIFGIRNRSIL